MTTILDHDQAFRDRLKWALDRRGKHLGTAVRMLAGRFRQPAVLFFESDIHSAEWRGSQQAFWPMLVDLAAALEQDPRWLITGVPTPASAHYLRLLRGIVGGKGILSLTLSGSDFPQVLERLPQPIIRGGVCRYCGWQEQLACLGGCCWIDERETICSACLEVRL